MPELPEVEVVKQSLKNYVINKSLIKVINKASQQSKTMASSKLSSVSKGLNIPGL